MYLTDRPRPGPAVTPLTGPGGIPTRRVGSTVILLGLVSMLTDISSEAVAAVLPLYLTAVLGLSPLAFGFVDGLYQGVSALVRILGGWLADRAVGETLRFTDARGSHRSMTVVAHESGRLTCELAQTAYFMPGVVLYAADGTLTEVGAEPTSHTTRPRFSSQVSRLYAACMLPARQFRATSCSGRRFMIAEAPEAWSKVSIADAQASQT